MLLGGRMNLVEYGQANLRWLWEMQLALGSFRQGQQQQADIQRQMEAALAGHRRPKVS